MLRDGTAGSEATWCGVDGDGFEQRCARLHRRLKRIVRARGALDAQEAVALREAESLRLWRQYGYGSLLEYMELEMGYSPRAALERLRVAKAMIALPMIAEAITRGELSFSAARELTRIATPDTEQEWLVAVNDKNLREIEDMVSGHRPGDKPSDPPDPALRKRRLRYDDIDDETVALVRQARELLDRELGERLTDNQLLRTFARMVIDGTQSRERTRAPYQIAVTVCAKCDRAWQDGGGITVEMSPPAREVAQCDAQHIGSLVPDVSADAAEPAALASKAIEADVAGRVQSDIPPALRRKVLARDHSRCRVPWCRSSRNIDLHHLVPRDAGGLHTYENLISMCESHHVAHHSGSLVIEGTASSATFTRRAHNSFTIAKHAIDTGLALKELGFDKKEIRAAMEKTRAHVGTSELTLAQWITIALRHCPRPTA